MRWVLHKSIDQVLETNAAGIIQKMSLPSRDTGQLISEFKCNFFKIPVITPNTPSKQPRISRPTVNQTLCRTCMYHWKTSQEIRSSKEFPPIYKDVLYISQLKVKRRTEKETMYICTESSTHSLPSSKKS